jgi:hypothetical protein
MVSSLCSISDIFILINCDFSLLASHAAKEKNYKILELEAMFIDNTDNKQFRLFLPPKSRGREKGLCVCDHKMHIKLIQLY